MILLILIILLFLILTLNLIISIINIKKVYKGHKVAHLIKYTNNAKFNQIYSLVEMSDNEMKKYRKPIVKIDNPRLKTIVFANNINSIKIYENNLLCELNRI